MTKRLFVSRNGPIETFIEMDHDGMNLKYIDRTSAAFLNNLLDSNLRARNDGVRRGDSIHAASVPMAIWQQWRDDWRKNYRGRMSWQEYRRKKHNDPNFAYFRTGLNRL